MTEHGYKSKTKPTDIIMGRKKRGVRTDTLQTVVYGSKLLNGNSAVLARFMPYDGDGCKCAKCVFCYTEECEKVPCNSDERHDKQNGFYRAANVIAV